MVRLTQRRDLGRGLLVAAAAVALMLTALVNPAGAATAAVVVSPSTVAVGGTVTISGLVPTSGTASCASGEAATVTSTVGLFPLGGFGPQAARSAAGSFSVTYTVPLSTPAATYVVGLRCGGGNVGVSTVVHVVAQVQQVPVGAPEAGLGGASAAGHPKGWLVAAAVAAAAAVLLAGFGLRRRRSGATR
jgi:hypothetical protein